MEIIRALKLEQLLKKKSYFLFGPRSIGKSTLIKQTIGKDAETVNLLNADTYLRLSERPGLFKEWVLNSDKKYVVIDEVQKLPILLDGVHELIEQGVKKHFLMTGSSMRKLKKENANFLGGRAGQLFLHTLSYHEIQRFDLQKYLRFGGMPRVALSDDPNLELQAYASTYLEQEIQIEARVRNLTAFSRFLKTAALSNAQLLNFTEIGNDAGVAPGTVREYYKILEDTLLGFLLEPFVETKKRKAIQTSKFFFFDLGVSNYIAGHQAIEPQTDLWGTLFEHFIALELRSYLHYHQKRSKLMFWRSINKHEVDFVVGNDLAIEVKATKKVLQKHFYGFNAMKEEKLIKKYIIVSNDPISRRENDYEILYWEDFFKNLWLGKYDIF